MLHKGGPFLDYEYRSRFLFLKSSACGTLLILCKLGKETRREWGEAVKKPTTEVSLFYKFPFLRNGKY